MKGFLGKFRIKNAIPHRIHVRYIYLHLVDFYGKCRYIYHTWILWVLGNSPKKEKKSKTLPFTPYEWVTLRGRVRGNG